jgi:hypothetical protein
MSKRTPRPSPYLEHPEVEVLKIVMTPYSARPPRRGRGHPVDADAPARAEKAADMVLRQKTKNIAWGLLVETAARAHRVGEKRVWTALRKRPEYKTKP